MLQIRKKLENVFKHFTDQGDFLLSKGYFKLDNGVFQIVEEGGARRFNYSLSEITIFDDTISGPAEVYTTDIGLYNRLVELRYNLLDLNGLAPIDPVANITETPLDLSFTGSNIFTLPENYILVSVFLNIALQKYARYVRTSTGIIVLDTLAVNDVINVRGFVTSGNFSPNTVSSVNTQVGDVVLNAANVGAPSGSGNSTNTNTGDETTLTIQSKRPLKTVNSLTLEGSGNILLNADNIAPTATRVYLTPAQLTAIATNTANIALKSNKSRTIYQGFTTVTGVTVPTIAFSVLIPANTYQAVDGFSLTVTIGKSSTATSVNYNLFNDTVVNGNTQVIAFNVSLSGTQKSSSYQRFLNLSGGIAYNNNSSGANSLTPFNSSNASGSDFAFNPAVNNFITLEIVGHTVASEISNVTLSIQPLKG
jgi:hypothetical protein